MGTTALNTARQEVGKMAHEYEAASTTTNITTNNTIVDTKLANIGYAVANIMVDYWIWLNTTANASREGKISANTNAGSLTITGTALAAESSSQSFEIHKLFRPTDITSSLNRAINESYDCLWSPVEDMTLHTRPSQTRYTVPTTLIDDIWEVRIEDQLWWDTEENLFLNGGFDDYSSTFTSWGTPTGITITQVDEDTGEVLHGDHAAKCVVTASTAASWYQTISNPSYYASRKLYGYLSVYSNTASRVKAIISDNATSTSSTAFHTGTGWEIVPVTHTVTTAPSSLTAGVTAASGVAFDFYMDQAMLVPAEYYQMNPWPLLGGWRVFNNILEFRSAPTASRYLRLSGKKPLTAFTTDSSTTEIGDPQAQILYVAALLHLYKQYRQKYSGEFGSTPFDDDILYWESELRKYKRLYGMRGLPVLMGRKM